MNPRCLNVAAFLLPILLVMVSILWCPRVLAAPQETAKADSAPKAASEQAATRIARVKVIDASGDPVADASVIVQLNHSHRVPHLKTDDAGSAAFDLPAEARIGAVAAWKDHKGLDYRSYELPRQQQADALTEPPAFPFDDAQTLVLDGAAPLTVRIVDDQQHPLQDIRVYPWLLRKESEGRELNLSFFTKDIAQSTDGDGLTTFAWFPAWQKTLVTVWPDAAGFVRERGAYDPLAGDGQLEIKLARLVPIRGRVRALDGAPAPGIEVVAAGAGYTLDDGRASTVTDNDGNYELLVPPNQVYLLLVADKRWAATPHTGFVVQPNQPIEGKDFDLRAATRVHGKLLTEDSREPIAGESVFVYQYGLDLNSIEGATLPNPENLRHWVQPIHVFHTPSDDQGNFELFLGDGNFDIRPPRQDKADEFSIAGEAELAFEVTSKVHREFELRGVVRDESSGEPISRARIEGVPRSFRGSEWSATADEHGRFVVKRREEATYVYAASADKQLAMIAEIDPKQTEVTLSLAPVGSVMGRLLTADTKEPWPGQLINYAVNVPGENNQSWSPRFGGRVTTADDGTFHITGIAPGQEYSLTLKTSDDGRIPGLTKVKLEAGQTIDLGNVQAPPPYKPYVPPTLQERIEQAFEVAGTPLERHERALEVAKLVRQHVLVVFGTPDDPRIGRLMKLRFEDADYRPFADEFRLMAIPTDEPRRGAADELASVLDESLADERGSFLLVILDAKGDKVAAADAETLCKEGELSKDQLLQWLGQYMPQPPDARELLAAALAQAKREDKKVLIQETATWCGPCHMLSRFLEANRVWEKDYLWVKMDHRWTGARELMAEIRDGADGGIPWFAILDASGEKLTTSNDPQSGRNIGYPSSQAGQAHFQSMLRTTRSRLSDDDIASLIAALAGSTAAN